MSPPSGGSPVRCPFCVRTPLLATYGVDQDRKPYVHVRVYKQKRVFANIVATGGPVHLQCRECNRWLRINFVTISDVDLRQVEQKDVPGTGTPGPVGMVDAGGTV